MSPAEYSPETKGIAKIFFRKSWQLASSIKFSIKNMWAPFGCFGPVCQRRLRRHCATGRAKQRKQSTKACGKPETLVDVLAFMLTEELSPSGLAVHFGDN